MQINYNQLKQVIDQLMADLSLATGDNKKQLERLRDELLFTLKDFRHSGKKN